MEEITEEKQQNKIYPLHVCTVFLEVSDQFLLIKRSDGLSQGGLWNLPGGKKDRGESVESAAIREIYEETSIEISDLVPLGVLYFHRKEGNYILSIFAKKLVKIPTVVLNREHCSYKWVPTSKMQDDDFALKSVDGELIFGGEHVLSTIHKRWKNIR